jgi:two-component system chemotaxis response regulator CheY
MSYDVLIVDDSAVIRSALHKMLTMSGLDLGAVHEAANGREALEVLDQSWVDIMLVDLNMPDMNGVELIECLARDSLLVSIPVVVISSERRQTQIDELKERGIRAFVKKPLRPENLFDVVHKVLGGEDGP